MKLNRFRKIPKLAKFICHHSMVNVTIYNCWSEETFQLLELLTSSAGSRRDKLSWTVTYAGVCLSVIQIFSCYLASARKSSLILSCHIIIMSSICFWWINWDEYRFVHLYLVKSHNNRKGKLSVHYTQ